MLNSDHRPICVQSRTYNMGLYAFRVASCPTFPRGRMKERERAWSSRRRAAARLERSHQRASPLFFPPRAAAFSGSRVDPRLQACNTPALFYRALALITRHRGYYRGNAKRPSFRSFLPPLFFFLPLRHSESAANRNATLLATSFYTAHHVLHHVNDSTQLSEDTRNAWGIQQMPFRN